MAHAPIEPQTVADRELNKKWWDSLTTTIMGRKNVNLLIDANAHVGGEVSEHVGGLVVLRIKIAMVLPFMMFSELRASACLPLSQMYTWTCHRTGTHHRNDYIAIALDWAADAISIAVLEDIDTGATNVDHNPVSLVLESVQSSCGQGVDPFISKFHLDGSKLTNSACRQVFSDLLESVQPVSWNVDVDTHCRRLCKTLSDAACTAFAKNKETNRSRLMSLSAHGTW